MLSVAALVNGSLDFLPRAWSDEHALYSFKAELCDDGALTQDWSSPWAVRYTINSLLGVHAAHGTDADALVREFASRHAGLVTNPADLGLLTALMSAVGDEARSASALARVEAASELASKRLDTQSLSWMLWGSCAATRAGLDGAERVARNLLDRILRDSVHPASGLPRHSLSAYRRNIVSFGTLVYFLRALHEAERTLEDERAALRYREGLARALALQGPQGEWPWMIDVARGVAFDRYPVFSVHQDSMAMLFLLPAIDAGLPGARAAAERSLRWVHGENELGLRLYREEPFFFAYRAIERNESAPKLRRYVRWLARRGPDAAPPKRLRVNRECRSYHLGWILYAWAPRERRPPAPRTERAHARSAPQRAAR
jgi:hypothetical protein